MLQSPVLLSARCAFCDAGAVFRAFGIKELTLGTFPFPAGEKPEHTFK